MKGVASGLGQRIEWLNRWLIWGGLEDRRKAFTSTNWCIEALMYHVFNYLYMYLSLSICVWMFGGNCWCIDWCIELSSWLCSCFWAHKWLTVVLQTPFASVRPRTMMRVFFFLFFFFLLPDCCLCGNKRTVRLACLWIVSLPRNVQSFAEQERKKRQRAKLSVTAPDHHTSLLDEWYLYG